MFYLMLILLLYRFYSNCDLTEKNPSVVSAVSWHMYISVLFPHKLLFSIHKKTQVKITL